MPNWLVVIICLAAIAAILASTETGRRIRRRLPVPGLRAGRASKEDRDYFLRVCDGDRDRVERLLNVERARNPEMTEAEAYRRAIRTYLRDKM